MRFEVLPVTRFEQNCSVLHCEHTQKAAVIDPGGEIWQILNYLEWLELELEVILVTHGHADHAGGVAELAAHTNARVEGPHKGDAHLAEHLDQQSERLKIPGQKYVPHSWLEDGDQINFGKCLLEVLHCPGHTRGHVAYFDRSSRQAFVGDILFYNAIGAWEHTDGNLPQLISSIRSKLFPLGDDVRFVPGHGPTSTFGREKAENPFVSDDSLEKWHHHGK